MRIGLLLLVTCLVGCQTLSLSIRKAQYSTTNGLLEEAQRDKDGETVIRLKTELKSLLESICLDEPEFKGCNPTWTIGP